MTRGISTERIKHWLRCVAVVNICLIRIWSELLTPAGDDFERLMNSKRYYAALVLMLLLGSLLHTALRGPRWLRYGAVILTAAVALKETALTASNFKIFSLWNIYPWLSGGRLTLLVAFALSGVGLLVWSIGRHPRIWRTLATATVPFAILTTIQALWLAPQAKDRVLRAHEVPGQSRWQPRPRVVWIILDELDERVAFSQRPSGVELPALDRFRREAGFVAREAISPANATAFSLPSLLDGKVATRPGVMPAPGVVEAMRKLGMRTAIAGWSMPYCATVQGLASCGSWPLNWQSNSYGEDFLPILRAQLRGLVETHSFSLVGQSQTSRMHVSTVEAMRRKGAEMAGRPDLDFVFLHLPGPHPPFVYDPETRRPNAWSWPKKKGYLNNLRYADDVFASIRLEMERTGVWEKSVVLVSADHGYRGAATIGFSPFDRHVPFMLKLVPGLKYDRDPGTRLETVESGRILLDLLVRAGGTRPRLEPESPEGIEMTTLRRSGAAPPSER